MFCFLRFSIYFRIICLLFFHFYFDLFVLCFCFVFISWLALLFYAIFLNRCFFVVSKARCNSLGRSEDTVVKCQKDFKRNKQIGNRPRWFRQAGRRVGGQDGRIASAKYIAYMGLIKIPLSGNGHSSRIKNLLSRNFRELHVYPLRGPCWPTTPLIKIRSPPGKLRQRITDHFLITFFPHAASITESLLRAGCCWLRFLGKVYWPTPFNMHFDFRPLTFA